MANHKPLARKITLPLLVFYGLGNILGAGIYVLIGKVAEIAGILAPLAFLSALVIVAFTALSYMELSSRFPVAAGVAAYVHEGINVQWLYVGIGLLMAAAGVISAAAITQGVSGYINEFIDISKPFSIAIIVFIITLIAIWGIGESVKIAAALTLLEITGLLIIIYVGFPALKDLPSELPVMLKGFNIETFYLVLLGGFLAFYAFLGFEDMVTIAEEVKQPQNIYPKAIFIALTMATLLYITVSLVSVLLATPLELASTDAPFAFLYKRATGEDVASVISFISIFAIVNGVLIQIIMVSRIIYGMSVKGWMPKVFTLVNARTQTPIVSTVLVSFMVMLLALWFPLVELANLTSSLILLVFTVVNISLIRIKLNRSKRTDGFQVPLFVPILGLVLNLGFLALKLLSVV